MKLDTFLKSQYPEEQHLARLPSPFNGLGFYGGFRYGTFIGLLLGYEYYFSRKRTTSINGVDHRILTRPNNAYFAIRGFYPILMIPGLEIIGDAGAIINDFSFSYNQAHVAFDKLRRSINVNIRMGLGMDFFITRHWGIHIIYHYITNHFNERRAGGWKAFWTVNMGMDYLVD